MSLLPEFLTIPQAIVWTAFRDELQTKEFNVRSVVLTLLRRFETAPNWDELRNLTEVEHPSARRPDVDEMDLRPLPFAGVWTALQERFAAGHLRLFGYPDGGSKPESIDLVGEFDFRDVSHSGEPLGEPILTIGRPPRAIWRELRVYRDQLLKLAPPVPVAKRGLQREMREFMEKLGSHKALPPKKDEYRTACEIQFPEFKPAIFEESYRSLPANFRRKQGGRGEGVHAAKRQEKKNCKKIEKKTHASV